MPSRRVFHNQFGPPQFQARGVYFMVLGHNPLDMYPPDTYHKDIYPPDTYPLDTYPQDTYPLGQIPPGQIPPEQIRLAHTFETERKKLLFTLL